MLKKIDKNPPFSVPENYFEDFALEMDKKIAAPKTIQFKKIKSWMYAAAIFTGLVVFGGTYYIHLQNEKNTTYAENYESYVLSQVDESSMMDYYLANENK